MAVRKLIRYAGWEPTISKFHRKIPVERAMALRETGMTWQRVAQELSDEYERDLPYTADGVQSACGRLRKKEMAT